MREGADGICGRVVRRSHRSHIAHTGAAVRPTKFSVLIAKVSDSTIDGTDPGSNDLQHTTGPSVAAARATGMGMPGSAPRLRLWGTMRAEDSTASAGAAMPLAPTARRAATGRHADLWHQFSTLRHGSRWQEMDRRRTEVLTNLVELVAFAEPRDYVRLHELIRRHGHEEVAGIQGWLGNLMGDGDQDRVETGLIWRIGDEGPIRDQLTAAGIAEDDAADVAASCYSHMFWLLLRDIDRSGPPPVVRTPGDFVDLVKRGTVREWRASLAPLAASPWSQLQIGCLQPAHGESRGAALLDRFDPQGAAQWRAFDSLLTVPADRHDVRRTVLPRIPCRPARLAR